jgi:hypothetical protein
MKTHASENARRPVSGHPESFPPRRRGISWFARAVEWTGIPAAPSAEEAERRVRGRPTLLASVTPEILAAFDAFEGTQFVGRQEPRRRPGENRG